LQKIENDIYEEFQEIVQNEENSTHENDYTDTLKNEINNLSTEKS
jgi:hypothetical protein